MGGGLHYTQVGSNERHTKNTSCFKIVLYWRALKASNGNTSAVALGLRPSASVYSSPVGGSLGVEPTG